MWLSTTLVCGSKWMPHTFSSSMRRVSTRSGLRTKYSSKRNSCGNNSIFLPARTTVRLSVGSIELDLLKRTVVRAGKNIELLPQEFRLLEYFVRNPDRVLTRRMLLENVWGIHFDPQTSVVESHISRLRGKVNHGFEFDVIQTVRGTGYKFLAPN